MVEVSQKDLKNRQSTPATCVFVDNHVAGGVDTFVRLLIPRLSSSPEKLLLIVNQTYPDLAQVQTSWAKHANIVVYSSVFQRPWFTQIGVTPRNRIVEKIVAVMRRLCEYLILPFEVLRLRRNLLIPPRSNVLVVNGGYPGSYTAIAASIAFSKRNTVSLNIHNLAVPRTLASWPFDSIIDWLVRRRVRTIIGVSRMCETSLKSRFSSQSIPSAVVYNAVETASVVPSAPSVKRSFRRPIVLGLVGTLDHRKGHVFAIKLLAQLQEALPSTTFLLRFVGSDPYHLQDELKELATSLEVIDRVQFVGYRTSHSDIYSDLDFVLVPSTSFESFGLVAIEAVAAGVHVLASSAGALPEILQGLPNCTVLPTLETDDWVSQIESILTNICRVDPATLNGYATCEKLQRFLNPDQMVREYIEILRSLSTYDI